MVAGGLALLVLGAEGLVRGAVAMARLLGASELVIGLTVVAAGTSLPELATSVVASLRGERDIAVGNIIGSNVFNLLAVLGASAAASVGGTMVAPSALRFDIPIMAATAVACLPVFFSGGRISRGEGLLFLFLYAAYVAFLVMHATGSIHAASVATVVGFALPLSAAGILLSAYYTLRSRRRQRGAK